MNGVLEFLNLQAKYGSIVSDLMLPYCFEVLNSARVIAKFSKESNGDYSDVVDQNLFVIVSQMKQNEINKNKQSFMRR